MAGFFGLPREGWCRDDPKTMRIVSYLASAALAFLAVGQAEEFELPFRQIHLDFHTSGLIPDVGADFDPEEFAATLDAARVNSVTCFGRGHHGWLYYPSKKFPERVHPNLKRPNLLGEQIDACHKRGIRVPIYITLQWDEYVSSRHPEWVIHNKDGSLHGDSTNPVQNGFYRRICLNTPYVDFLKEHLTELFETVPVDGLFLDIIDSPPCYCDACKKGMASGGIDIGDDAAVQAYAGEVMTKFRMDLTAHIRKQDDDCTIFYNSGHIGPGIRPAMDAYTHLEMESLPAGSWGYIHFPLSARYVRNLGKEALGMTGKFHTSWGDFHSFKNPAALQFECFNMLALGAKCSIGDQLHPSGKIDPATYKLIGSVYSEVEKKEPWCRKVRALTDIGVLSPEEFTGERIPESAAGVVRMLQEGRHQFDFIDSQSDFTPFKVLILPDVITVDDALATKLDGFLAGGGSVLASYESGLDPEKQGFRLSPLGVKLVDDHPLEPSGQPARGKSYGQHNFVDYVMPQGVIGAGLEPTEHVMYMRGLHIAAEDGAETMVSSMSSYFDRAGDRFCSHKQTPSSGKVSQPAIVRNGNCVYFAHPVFTQYCRNAPRWCRTLVLNALETMLPEPLVRVDGPSTALASLNEQADEDRWVLHLLHYIPERRGKDFDIIEDVIPLHELPVSVTTGKTPKAVTAVPRNVAIPFETKDGRTRFTLPKLEGHQMISIQF